MTLAGRIVVLEFGKIAQVGTPRELYERPANLFVAQFIGSPKMNVMPCSASGGHYQLEGGRGAACPSDQVTQLGIRPEHITLGAPETGQCDGRVDVVEFLGADTFILFDCGALGSVNVRVAGDTALAPGDVAGLAFSAEHTVFFDKDGLAV
jgi:multiple sugar transport system ATP-binding protein